MKQPKNKFNEAKKALEEAEFLLDQDTLDSLLRYFQTGVLENETHLPSLLRNYDAEIQIKLAEKMEQFLTDLGFGWNQKKLKKGIMVLEYTEDKYRLEFATFIPTQRALKFHFDFMEMEREREIKLSKINQKIKETKERYLESKEYLRENSGLKKYKNIKSIERIEENMKNIGKDIDALKQEIKETQKQKKLLEAIKKQMEDVTYRFRRYGIVLEYAKNEEFDI